MLRSAGRSLERVVVFGLEGVGKSECALDIATRIGPDRTLWVVDNDNAWDRMLEGVGISGDEAQVRAEYRWLDGEWVEDDAYATEDGNVVVYHVDDGGWDANVSALKEVKRDAERQDWCCVDSGSALWDDVQAWFTESVFTSSMSDYFMQVRLAKAQAEKDAKALGAFDGWVDWPVINAVYKDNVMKFLVNPPCHLIVCCEQADVTSEEKDKETRALYKDNVKPRGQKRIGHNVQTVIQLRRDRSMTFTASTIKDRGGRERLVMEDVTDRPFPEWYLEEVAGWIEDEDSVAPVAKSAPVVAKKG